MTRFLKRFLPLLVLSAACVRPVPVPVPPDSPAPPVVLLGALDVSTQPRYPAITIFLDGQPFTAAPEPNCQKTDDTGAGFCSNVPVGTHVLTIGNLPPGVTGDLVVTIPIEQNATTTVVFHLTVPEPPPPPPNQLLALTVNGLGFYEGGRPWVYRGFTDFLLYQRFLAGEDLSALLRERVAVGANTLRVLGMVTSFSHFYPQEHEDYYARLPAFAALLGSYGLRLEFVVFADAQVVMPDVVEETQHLEQVVSAFRGTTSVLLEVANEPFKNLPGGAAAATALAQRIQGRDLLVATGNYDFDLVVDHYELYSADYVTFHPERKPEWPRTSKDAYDLRDGFCCNPGWAGFHKPVVSDEPMGAAEVDSASRSAQPDDFAYFAAESALAGAGGTFHSDNGVRSERLGPVQLLSARAFFAAQQWVPVIAQFSPYQRGDAFGGPGVGNMPLEHTDATALRTFCKFANGDEYCVVIRPTNDWVAEPRDGWRILDQSGPHGALVHLGR